MRASKELEKTEGGSYMERRDKVNYYLDLAEMVSQRSTCLRKHYGAVIVNNDEVTSTGLCGRPSADGKTVPISVAASARSFMCRAASGTSCAAVSMPRQMP